MKRFLLIACALFAAKATARPVAYLGAWSVMSESRVDQSEAMIGYTFHRQMTVGLHASSYRLGKDVAWFAAPYVAATALRWNDEGRQSNLYLGAGYGMSGVNTFNAERLPGSLALLEADTETRSVYVSIRSEHVTLGGEDFSYARARIGLAPFLAAMGGLHTWILLQDDYSAWTKTNDVTPMLRFFFQNILWELGISVKGHAQMNWTVEI